MTGLARGAYTLLFILILPALMIKLVSRSRRAHGESNTANRFMERFALSLPKMEANAVIFHCASVGETLAAAKLITLFIEHNPHQPVIITSTSPTAATIIAQRFGDKVKHIYLPFDLPLCVRWFFKKLQPRLVVILETEIWPNLCYECHKLGIPLILLNARLSKKSYTSYKKFAALSKPVINKFNFICCQNQSDAAYFLKLGLAEDKLRVFGNLKFAIDAEPDTEINARKISDLRLLKRPAWLAASTHPGEDEIMLAAHKRLLDNYPDLILILAPRHPHRTSAIESLIKDAGLLSVRHTSGRALETDEAVYIVDTVGELMTFFAIAELCFIGGSLIAHGGHNPLEAAALKKPIVSGKQVHNFAKIYQEMETAQAVLFATDSDALYTQMDSLIADKEQARAYGERAFAYLQQHQGAIENSLALLNSCLK